MDNATVFPAHVFDALGVDPLMHPDPISGTIRVLEKRPPGGPTVMMTIGASLLATDSGERVEFAVETIEGQLGAAIIAMKIVCDDMAANRRVPPVGTPWRNSEPSSLAPAYRR